MLFLLRTKTFFASFLILLTVTTSSFAHAHDEEDRADRLELKKEQLEKRVELWHEKKEEWKDNRCKVAGNRIDGRINLFEKRKDFHVAKYQNLKTKIQELSDRLEREGYDTSELEADLKTLDSKIKTAAGYYSDFIAKLKAAKEFDCGNSEGDFVEAIKKANESRIKFHEALKDIRKYINETIRPDIKELREQKKDGDND